MSAFSDYLEGELIKHLFRTGTFTKPTVLAVSLHTGDPLDNNTGANEVSGGAYARVDTPPLDANWAAPTAGDGVTSNVSAITFPAPTANWGTITHVGIYDATTAGNLLFSGALTASKIVNNGDPAFTFNAGELTITLA